MNEDFEARFYGFLRERGYIEDAANLRHLQYYVKYFAAGEHVLDVGCGRGEFLQLLEAAGCRAEGIDIDPLMVRTCEAKGLNVVQGDALESLPLRSEQYDGVFASNFVEHLTPAKAVEFFAAVRQALKPGGKFLVALPNPESIVVHLYEFWRDATHVRLYNRQLVEFLFEYAGYRISISDVNFESAWQPALPGTQGATVSQSDLRAGLEGPTLGHLRAVDPAMQGPISDRAFSFAARRYPKRWRLGELFSRKNSEVEEVAPAGRGSATLPDDGTISPTGRGRVRGWRSAVRSRTARWLTDLLGDQFRSIRAENERLRTEQKVQSDTVLRLAKRLDVEFDQLESQFEMVSEALGAIPEHLAHFASTGSETRVQIEQLIEHTGRTREEMVRAIAAVAAASESLRDSTLFLYPPREFFVLGTKSTA